MRLPAIAIAIAAALGAAGCGAVDAMFAQPQLTPAELAAAEAAAGCDVTPITLYTTVRGELSPSDCYGTNRGTGRQYEDNPNRVYRAAGQRVDYFAFRYVPSSYAGATQVWVGLVSGAFDGYLLLMDKDGHLLVQDDDGGGGLNALITAGPADGVYLIGVTSRRPGETGPYTMRVAEEAVRPPR